MFRSLAMLLLLPLLSSGQVMDTLPWSPAGATWVYTISPSFGSLKFQQYRYIKDTMYYGRMAKQMEVTDISYLGIPPVHRTQSFQGYVYYSISNDTLYRFASGAYRFYLNFNPSPGDEWIVGNEVYTCPQIGYDPYDTLVVHTIGQVTLGNRTFKTFYADDYNNKRVYLGKIFKDIGSSMSPYPHSFGAACTVPYDVGAARELICYMDNLRGSVAFNNTSMYTCHGIMTSLPETQMDNSAPYVFPNPARDHISILNLSGMFQFNITDLQGRTIVNSSSQINQINIEKLQPGMYMIRINQKNKSYQLKFIKR